MSEIKYQCHESDCQGIYTESELKQLYYITIDKSNFADYDSWLDEMIDKGILNIKED